MSQEISTIRKTPTQKPKLHKHQLSWLQFGIFKKLKQKLNFYTYQLKATMSFQGLYNYCTREKHLYGSQALLEEIQLQDRVKGEGESASQFPS